MEEIIEIQGIQNFYGGLNVVKRGGKFFWTIENYYGLEDAEWEEISETLYNELIKHNKNK